MKEFSNLEKRPQYFSFYLECCDLLGMLDTEQAGEVILAVCDYFLYGDEPLFQAGSKEMRVFRRFKRDIDAGCQTWLKKAKGGEKGGNRSEKSQKDGEKGTGEEQ